MTIEELQEKLLQETKLKDLAIAENENLKTLNAEREARINELVDYNGKLFKRVSTEIATPKVEVVKDIEEKIPLDMFNEHIENLRKEGKL